MSGGEIVMGKGVRLKKNVIIGLVLAIGVVALISAKTIFKTGDVVPDVRREYNKDSKMVAANRRILNDPSISPKTRGQGIGIGVRHQDPLKGRIHVNPNLGQVQPPKRFDVGVIDGDDNDEQFVRGDRLGEKKSSEDFGSRQPRTTSRPTGVSSKDGVTSKLGQWAQGTLDKLKEKLGGGDSKSTVRSTSAPTQSTPLRSALGGGFGNTKRQGSLGQTEITGQQQPQLGGFRTSPSLQKGGFKTSVSGAQGGFRNGVPTTSTGQQGSLTSRYFGAPTRNNRTQNAGDRGLGAPTRNGQYQNVGGPGFGVPTRNGQTQNAGDQGFRGTAGSNQYPSAAGQGNSAPNVVAGGDPFEGLKFYDGSGNLVMREPKWIVVTSIQAPTADVKALSQVPGWKVIVIGDTKTPTDWKWPNVVYLNVEQQNLIKLRVLKYIPYKSYARKNIGYLFAIKYGAQIIYDTDDDNKPNDGLRSFTLDDEETTSILIIKNMNKTYNPYPHFGQQSIWPRGYPLDEVSNDVPREYQLCETRTPMLKQGIVNGDPDVDAIYRLLRKHPTTKIDVLFDVHSPRVLLPPKIYAPYNSQNTISTYEAFWGLAFPVTPAFRVCDIWRSYWAQRLMWLIGGQVGFYTAGTFQLRSAHSYLADFKDEKQFYYEAADFVKFLDSWTCQSNDFFECVKQMSYDMVPKKLWNLTDAKFIEAWLEDLKSVTYKPPTMRPVVKTQCVRPPTNVIYYPQEQRASYGEVAKYYYPGYVREKFDNLGDIAKKACPKVQDTYAGLALNGSSLINDILLIIHLDDTPTSDLIARLELFYRPRYGQILYCGKWNENAKSIFHSWRASIAEISGSSSDPQMECLYKAAEMHYIVEGYMSIHQNALLNLAQMGKDKKTVWMAKDWATPLGGLGKQCQDKHCGTAQIDLNKAAIAVGSTPSAVTSCALNKQGVSFSYSKTRVFYTPSTFDKQLRKASKGSLEGLNMAAWVYCSGASRISLNGVATLKEASQTTDYVQRFDFTDMNMLCPVLGFNP